MANELILIVEDNPKNLKLMRETLQVKGYQTIEAETGEEGVRPAQAFTARAQAGYLGCEQCASSSMAAGFAEGERNLVRR